MKGKLLAQLREEARKEIGVFYNAVDKIYEVVHKDWLGTDIGKYYVTKNFREARTVCNEYRRVLILKRVREMRFGYEDAREGRVY